MKFILPILKHTIMSIAEEIIGEVLERFEISGAYNEDIIPNINQLSAFIAEFTLRMVNLYLQKIGSNQRFKLVRIYKNTVCNNCNMWYDPSKGCPSCYFVDSSDDEECNPDDDDQDVIFYRRRATIMIAQIEQYVSK
jgi:hypothetical protein